MTSRAAEMHGKVVLITGCTGSMGRETALALARMGATVVGVSRTKELGEQTVAEIRERSGNAHIELLVADLASQADVRRLAKEFQSRHERLDVLINNAATFRTSRVLTTDGIELTLAVNYLAPFLLSHLLLDPLRASAPARIINVSGEPHKRGFINFDDLHGERSYSLLRATSQAKLALTLFTFELAERLRGTSVTVNALHPGFVPAGTAAQYMPKPVQLLFKLVRYLPLPFVKTPREGAQTAIYLASSPDVVNVTGQYFIDCQPAQPAPIVYDVELRQRLWTVSAELTGLSLES